MTNTVILCFQNGDVCKSSETVFSVVERKKLPVCVERMEGLQVNHQEHMQVLFDIE